MLPAILGGLATGAGSAAVGGLVNMFGGGGTSVPQYQPSEMMQKLTEYGAGQLEASKRTRRAIKEEARTYSSPGAKEAFLQSYIGRFSNPKFLEKELIRSYRTPIDYTSDDYANLAALAYEQQGLKMPQEDFERYMKIAKATNVRSPEAFGDIARQSLIASGKVKTPQDELWEMQYGSMPRDDKGNLMRGMVRVNPGQAQSLVRSMLSI